MYFMVSSKNYSLPPLTFCKGKKKKEKQISNVNANAIFSSLMISEVTLILTFAYHSFTNILLNASKGTEVKKGIGVI